MEELPTLVSRSCSGDPEAFDGPVSRFRDLAYGYAYSLLRDFGLAEDATQEAFLQAYLDLPALREPRAFPAWLRRIVFKECDRLTRRKRLPTLPLEAAAQIVAPDLEPGQDLETRERQAAVQTALHSLPPREREVTLLFYIKDYSQQEIADFLQLPVTTVNNRLHAARKRLKGRLLEMVKQTVKEYRLPEEFRVVIQPASRVKTAAPALTWFKDRWVLVWQDGEAGDPWDHPYWFFLAESRDGRTWSEPRRLPLAPQLQFLPKLAVAGEDLVLHTFDYHHGARTARTRDLVEWVSDPILALGNIGRSGLFTRGRTLFLAYPRWCEVHSIGDSVELLASEDHTSWRWLTPPYPTQGTGVTDAAGLAANGRLYVAWRGHAYTEHPANEVCLAWSEDDGRTWSQPVPLPPLTTNKASFMLQLMTNPAGDLVVVQDERDEQGNSEIVIVTSPDQGKTWPYKATYSTGSLVDPAVAFMKNGTLLLAGSAREGSGSQAWVVHSRLEK